MASLIFHRKNEKKKKKFLQQVRFRINALLTNSIHSHISYILETNSKRPIRKNEVKLC